LVLGPALCAGGGSILLPRVLGYAQGEPVQTSRVVRGGAFNNNSRALRGAYRNNNDPENRNDNLGFRVVFVSR